MTAREQEQAAVGGLLRAVEEELGHPLSEHWREAAQANPRHHFLPETIWTGEPLKPCHQAQDPQAWFAAAYANAPVVTQVNDGHDPEDDPWPSSSASAPGIVFRMLEDLSPEQGQQVLEVGAGTGYNAALLAHYVGDGNVVTVELDERVAEHARKSLAQTVGKALVVCADGTEGWAHRAPYERIIATCSVRRIPGAWLKQLTPGGRIVTPWDNPWVNYGLLSLQALAGHQRCRVVGRRGLGWQRQRRSLYGPPARPTASMGRDGSRLPVVAGHWHTWTRPLRSHRHHGWGTPRLAR